jgi:hypothetical protein
MNKLHKNLAYQAAVKFQGQPEKQDKLKDFFRPWVKAFFGSQQDKMDIQFKPIKANHRHANDETSRRYIHALDKEHHKEMEKLVI